MKKSILFLIAACAAATVQAQGLLDMIKTKTESKELFLVYDLPSFKGTSAELKDRVREALTHHGDNAYVKENLIGEAAPTQPGKLVLKRLGAGLPLPVNINIPVCDGALFTVSSSDNSMASYGDAARYMACGFRYSGGYRVNMYSAYQTTSGGVAGLLSGKTIGSAIAGAVGLKNDPQQFIESSLAKLEEIFGKQGWTFNIVEMSPALAGKTVVADPLAVQSAQAEKKKADRATRMAARAELQKLGIDASDRTRMLRAVDASDEDLVALFVEAGAIDLTAPDANGKLLVDYAKKPAVKALLGS